MLMETNTLACESPGIPVSDEINDVFEGPEKKLEVFFDLPPTATGFRSFDEVVWSDVLSAAKCTILHTQPSAAFDAYLLSESSLFVYPSRVILKTCGTTTLLLVLPKLLELAASIGASLEHVHYSRFRFKFPDMQVYPHTSFDVEKRYLEQLLDGHVAAVHSKVLGDPSQDCWYALCTEALALPEATAAEAAEPAELPADDDPAAMAEPARKKLHVSRAPSLPALARQGSALPKEVDDLFEVVMEGLPAAVCALFFEHHPAHDGARAKALAASMTARSGIGAFLEGVLIDDWAFEPCGYSMNGSRGAYYYTIHITPELGFSYASFETNDPAFRAPAKVAAVVDTFKPSSLTITLTTRRVRCELPTYEFDGVERISHDHHHLCPEVSVCCQSFSAPAALPTVATVETAVAKAKGGGAEGGLTDAADADASGSEASSEDTCELTVKW